MFKSLRGRFSADLAIDLGTANTLVYVPGRGIVLEEPSVVAIQHKSGHREVLAVGEQAKNMLGRTPENIETIRPMRDGVIADYIAAEEMIKQFMRRAISRNTLSRPATLICVPAGSTPVERRAVYEAGLSAGARKVHLIEEPVAAALGVGLPIHEPTGCMVVDIGGGTTDIAVISLGGVLYARSIRVAGNAMDQAIINYIRRHYHLLIGEASAERIKIEVGSAIEDAVDPHIDVQIKGRDLRRGMPTEIILGPVDIARALADPIDQIADAIRRALEDMPPELSSDIVDRGIYLTGGGALLEKLDQELANKVGVRFQVADDPMHCVVMGSGLALERLDDFQDLLIKPQ